VADWTLAALNDLQNRAKGTIDLTSLIERGKDFRTVARRFDALTSEIAETIKSVGAAKKDEGRIAVTNRVMVKICRTLNPINYTLSGRYGQDHYGAEYIKPIPVLQPLSELAKLNPDTSQYKALRTKLVRERNRVADALEEAQWLAEHVL
jgi:predicted Zn-dependent protease